MTTSKHYANDRKTREDLIATIGMGEVIFSYYWDRGHKNGPEIHKVTSTGIVVIYNYYSRKMITKLIARPKQLERYFGIGKVPTSVMALAIEHQRLGYNNF